MNLSSLLNLPSREGGFLSRVVESPQTSPGAANPASPGAAPADPPNSPGRHQRAPNTGELRAYVCDHSTAPPAHQYITTDKTNILIRTLTQRRSKDALAANPAATHQQKLGVASASGAGARPRIPAFGAGAEASGSEGARADNKRGAEAAAAGDGGGRGGASGGGGGLGRRAPSGLERASKRPAIDATAEYRRLESLTAEQLREYLRGKGQTGGLEGVGRAALLSRAKLAVAARGGR